MPARRTSVVFRNPSKLGTQTDSLSAMESALLDEITRKSRLGASAYLLKIKDYLQQSGPFIEFLRTVKDLKDGRIDPPFFIQGIAETLNHSLELISESVAILPSDCLLQLQKPNKNGSLIVTLRYPANTTVPIHVVCRPPSQEAVGFFGYPGPTPNPTPSPQKSQSSLKRKRSSNLRRAAAVIINNEDSMAPAPIERRRSQRLKLKREAESSMRGSQSFSSAQPSKLTVPEVVSLFIEVFSDQTKRRRLMKYKEEKAQLVIDTMQALVDVPDIIPLSRLKLKQGLIKLSAESSLPPTCFSLCGLNIDDFSPSDCPDGSFGEIYSGSFHGQPLCLKVVKLRHQYNMDKAVKAFLKEGVTWGQINHPNVLPFYGIYQLQDKYNRLSLVSPWLAYGNVNKYLDDHPTVDRLLLVYDIIQGIAHLHKERIIHGDLKGPNILVTKAGRACIADFGLATMNYEKKPNWTSLRSSRTAVGGTLRWQAPELLESELLEPNASGDVYAFGCIMYEVFTGRIPFHEIIQQVRVIRVMLEGRRPTRPVSTDIAWTQWGLTEKIWKLMEQCWETDPNDRPLASQIVEMISGLGPNGVLKDTRATRDDEYLSPSAFRHAVHAKLNPLSEETIKKVVQWLRE